MSLQLEQADTQIGSQRESQAARAPMRVLPSEPLTYNHQKESITGNLDYAYIRNEAVAWQFSC